MADTNLAILLRCCLSEGRRGDWEQFMQDAQPIVAAAVLRTLGARTTSLNRELADDLIQETFLKMCAGDFRVLRNFQTNDGYALRVYLKTIAASTVMDHFRSSSTVRNGSGILPASLEEVTPWLSAHDRQFDAFERRMMVAHVEKCLGKQDQRYQRIFWLYHLQEMKPRVIAALPDIAMTVDAIETAVYRLTKAVRECLRKAASRPGDQLSEGGRT